MHTVSRCALVTSALLLGLAAAHAQSVCSSDGQLAPAGLLERFINADCEGCWTDTQVPLPAPGQVALDWIVPGSRGEDAPLAAAARSEGLQRLEALREPVPRNDAQRRQQRQGPIARLRVAQGQVFNGYLGASVELQGGGRGPWRAFLALVETLPPGSERNPVERNLVRNVLELDWDDRTPSKGGPRREARPMNIPEGARPDRLRLIGWVQDARGRIRGIAQSRCAPPTPGR